MSLVESVLARVKKVEGSAGVSTSAPDSGKRRPPTASYKADAAAPAPAPEPTERIVAAERTMHRQGAIDNRVLLEDRAGENSAAAAAYRILRARLLRRVRTHGWTTIGVTSATPDDGKSLTVLNLGISLAREGNSEVVLLDLDLRDPSLCQYLGLSPPGALQDYFARRSPASEMFFSIGVDNLLVAAATERTDRASELLGSREFDDLIQYIKRRCAKPIILIDLPPVLVTDDVLVVAPKIDALLFVAAEGRTRRTDLEKALGLLSEYPMAGMVLNCALEAGLAYGYGYGYGYGLNGSRG